MLCHISKRQKKKQLSYHITIFVVVLHQLMLYVNEADNFNLLASQHIGDCIYIGTADDISFFS
jgi:hypothetical protein